MVASRDEVFRWSLLLNEVHFRNAFSIHEFTALFRREFLELKLLLPGDIFPAAAQPVVQFIEARRVNITGLTELRAIDRGPMKVADCLQLVRIIDRDQLELPDERSQPQLLGLLGARCGRRKTAEYRALVELADIR